MKNTIRYQRKRRIRDIISCFENGGGKMRGDSLKKRVSVTFILFLYFGFTFLLFCQDKKVNVDSKLVNEILVVYQSKGAHGLRNFIKKKKNEIPANKLIVYFAETAIKQGREEYAEISEILAEEKKLKIGLAYVYLKIADYFFINDYKRAYNCFDKALAIFIESNDPGGQGRVYLKKGLLYSFFKSNDSALKMYEMALPFFVRTGDFRRQGDVYMSKGIIYSKIGDNTRALELCEKALRFYEKVSFLKGKGNACYQIGGIFVHLNKYSKAIEMYDKAWTFLDKGETFIHLGDVFKRKGNIYFYKGDYVNTIKMYNQALIFFEKSEEPFGQSEVYYRKGDIYLHTGDISPVQG